ncbi:MAG: hypothetical protein INQ03_12405 [Candidatus Heimdallarchaeota archaeon]|nr:hypothetical protein [Candidatus Heimdallarchaeota archaeon]
MKDQQYRLRLGYSKETAEGIEDLLRNEGFSDIQVETKGYRVRYQDKEEYWSILERVGGSPLYEALGPQGTEMRNEFSQFILKQLENIVSDVGVIFKKKVIFASATKS